jgi:hypothetical protein
VYNVTLWHIHTTTVGVVMLPMLQLMSEPCLCILLILQAVNNTKMQQSILCSIVELQASLSTIQVLNVTSQNATMQ